MASLVSKLRQLGFTLIELLIVVIILAILAAIVIPQFTSATKDAQESALDANLNSMRSAIELFKVQHGGANPGSVASSGGAGCTGTAGTGAANTVAAFMDHLLQASNATGQTCSIADTTYKYGPYLRKGIPDDPFKGLGSSSVGITLFTTGAPISATAATGGWAYDTKSGQIVTNNNDTDTKSRPLYTH